MAFLSLSSVESAVDVVTRNYVLAEDASRFQTEADNRYVNGTVTLDPHATALVLIDVWDDSKSADLSDNENKRLLPLLATARALGMLVIHAPSEAPEWPAIKVLPGEVLVTGQDGRNASQRCDGVILNSTRAIKHVLMAGYDTNKCIVDKPCGSVALTTELAGRAQLLFVRDATRGEYGWFGNAWHGQHATLDLLSLGTWLPPAQRGIASLTLADLLIGAGAPQNASALAPLAYPAPSASHTERDTFARVPPLADAAALVVVSCSSDYANAGFRARVMENRARYLEPLLAAWRATALEARMIIHAPNGHAPDGACVPRALEWTVHSNTEFDALVAGHEIKTLFYVGRAQRESNPQPPDSSARPAC
jgi:hypothetical protein